MKIKRHICFKEERKGRNHGKDEVSIEEMREFFQSLTVQKEGDLSDAELDAVAGGKNEPYIPPNSVDMTLMECAAHSIWDRLTVSGCTLNLVL